MSYPIHLIFKNKKTKMVSKDDLISLIKTKRIEILEQHKGPNWNPGLWIYVNIPKKEKWVLKQKFMLIGTWITYL